MHDRFGSLRSVLQRPPSKETWDALCDELALWDDESLEREAIPYATSHLERWPAATRRAASADARRDWERTGWIAPALRAADHIEIPSIAALLQLARHPFAARFTSVTLGIADLGPHNAALAADALMRMPLRALLVEDQRVWSYGVEPTLLFELLTLPDLRALALTLSYAIREPAALTRLLAHDPRWAGLTDLSWRLGYLEPREMDLAALAASPHLTRLTALDLTGMRLAPGDEELLLRGRLLDHIQRLTLASTALQDASAIRLVHDPKLARLTHLDLSHNPKLSAATAQALASSPHMARLTALHLGDTDMGAAGCRALASSAHLTQLVHLTLDHARIDGDLDALFSSTRLPALRTLALDGNTLDPHSAARIADAQWPPQLQCPAWDRVNMSDEAAHQLARCPQLQHLTQLHHLTPRPLDYRRPHQPATAKLLTSPHLTGLRAIQIDLDASADADPLRSIAQNPALAHIEALRISGDPQLIAPDLCALLQRPHIAHLTALTLHTHATPLTDSAAPNPCAYILHAIAHSPHLARLTHLTTTVEAHDTAALKALLDSPRAAQLLHLELRGAMADEAALLLAHAPALANLHTLRLRDAWVSAPTLTALLTSPALSQLEALDVLGDLDARSMAALAHSPALLHTRGDLTHRHITAATLPILLDSPHLPQLRRLDLSHNPLGDAAAAILADHPALRHLDRLLIASTGITHDGLRLLAHSPHLSPALRASLAPR